LKSENFESTFTVEMSYQPDDPIELEEEEAEYFSGIDAIVVAIDCSPRMHKEGSLADATEKSVSQQSFLQNSLMAALEIMQRKVICSESDMVSILLFGTRSKQNSLGHENIHILFDLDVPSVERILALERFEQDMPSFVDKFGSSELFSIADVYLSVDLPCRCSGISLLSFQTAPRKFRQSESSLSLLMMIQTLAMPESKDPP
jgi:hypothetical protein